MTDPVKASPARIVDPAIFPIRDGFGKTNGSFGELLQGSLTVNDGHFMITLPIERFSVARFFPSDNPEIHVHPASKYKSLAVAKALLKALDLNLGGRLVLMSDLPEGKGWASSSADLVATLRAISAAVGKDVSNELMCRIMRDIEPSDGVMYPESVCFYHRKVRLVSRLGLLPPMKILAVDEGGIVNTIQFNRKSGVFSRKEQITYRDCLEKAEDAFKRQDLGALGQIATQSARLNQCRNPKKHLDAVIEICDRVGGLGVVITHSGPCLGLLLDKRDPYYREKHERALTLLAEVRPNVICLDTLTQVQEEFEYDKSPELKRSLDSRLKNN